jgi:DMSO/TMAO reductase YedYZ molybdopterin-dependent catalytic subunit
VRVPQEIDVVPRLESEDRRVLSEDPANAEASPEAFESLVTSASHRFLRCHFAVPHLGEDHVLRIGGAVVEGSDLTLPQLRALPSTAQTIVTECAGNGRASLEPPVSGEQWTSRAVSTAQWTGVPLPSLLELKENAVELVFIGADGGGRYRRSLPRDVAMAPGTLVAYEMNGAPIPPQFGGPLRLVVAGWYGMASVKWLARIDAVETPFHGEFQSTRYVYAPGVPVTRIRVKSMFTEAPTVVRAGIPVRIAGLAWGADGVREVGVEIDGRRREARLAGPALPHAWRRFELDWTPERRGRHVLVCRAVDDLGEPQPDEPDWNPLGYGNNAVQRVEVIAT